jgi:multiple sugar transport system permease protein
MRTTARSSALRRASRVGRHQFPAFLLMFVFAVLLLVPLLWVVSASVQNEGGIFQNPFAWLPAAWLWSNYATVWNGLADQTSGADIPALRDAFKSSLIVVALAVPLHVALNTYVGWVLAKYRFPLKAVLLFLILVTMMLPQAVTLFPNYVTVKTLGAIDSQWGIALPFLMSGFGVFLIMQFARGVPDEYLEAARLDGSSDLWIFVRIGVPLLKAAIATLTILMFTFIWNEYTWSHLVINSDNKTTLPLALVTMSQSSVGQAINIPAVLAGCVIAFLPILVVFLAFQRQFIAGVSQSGIKG